MRISDWSSDVCSSDLRGFDETVKLLKVAGKVVRMRDVLHLEVEQFLSAAADDLAIAIVDADEAARQVDLAEAGGRLVDQGRQMRLALLGRASCRERVCQYV